jgi:F420-non-reducing hydrogenase small subunit
MSKPKVAFYWCASCGGCEETVVDLAEDILGVVEAVDIVLWPVAMDFKYKDVEAMPDKSIVATLLNGAIRSTEQEEMARLLRRKSQFLIAYGSCAHRAAFPPGQPVRTREQILKFNYEDAPTVGERGPDRPQLKFEENGREVTLPELHNVVRSLDQVVDVDYYIPAARPRPRSPRPPSRRCSKASCRPRARCSRPTSRCATSANARPAKPADLSLHRVQAPAPEAARPREVLPRARRRLHGPGDPQRLRRAMHHGNMPCTGCFGPTSRVRDQGAKIMSSLCANIAPKEEGGIDKVLEGIPDPSAPSTATAWPRACCAAKWTC